MNSMYMQSTFTMRETKKIGSKTFMDNSDIWKEPLDKLMHAKCTISRPLNSNMTLSVMGVDFGFKIPMYQGYNIDITIIKYMQVNTSFNTELMDLQVKLKILKNLINYV